METLVLQNTRYGSVRKIGASIDFLGFESTVKSAIMSQVSVAYGTEAICSNGPYLSKLSDYLCDCKSPSGRECYGAANTTALRYM